VRPYWAEVSGPFRAEHHWIGYTPVMRMHAEVERDEASLYFEYLWMEVDTNAVGAHAFSDMQLARVKGHWLVKEVSSSLGKHLAIECNNVAQVRNQCHTCCVRPNKSNRAAHGDHAAGLRDFYLVSLR
jgi:hypothetical protein